MCKTVMQNYLLPLRKDGSSAVTDIFHLKLFTTGEHHYQYFQLHSSSLCHIDYKIHYMIYKWEMSLKLTNVLKT